MPNLKQLILFLLLCSLTACTTTLRNPDPPAGDLNLSESVIIDDANQSIYILSPERELEAIDPLKGTVKWRESTPLRPITIMDGSLVCQILDSGNAAPLSLAVIESKTGKTTERANARLSDKLSESYLQQNPGKLTLQPYQRNGTTYIAWMYRPIIRQGIYRESDENSLFSGQLELGNQGDLIRSETSSAATPAAGRSILAAGSARIPEGKGQQFISRDGRHVLVSDKISNDNLGTPYQWSIYEAGNPQVIGTLSSRVSYASFCVRGGFLIFVENAYETFDKEGTTTVPRQLVGYDLRAGRRQWTRPLFDDTFRGPSPS